MHRPFPRLRRPSLLLLALGGSASLAEAQVTFSIDYFGPSIGMPNSFTGAPIRPSDILTPATCAPFGPCLPAPGPLPPPGTTTTGGFPGLSLVTYAGCVGAPPGIPCPNEVDALSYGTDAIPPLGVAMPPGTWVFSVDEFAMAMPGALLAPNLTSEGVAPPVFDAGADMFQSLGLVAAPVPPGPMAGHTALYDGNGLPSASGAMYPGVGIFEPRPPMGGPGPRPGDNVDALDIGPGIAASIGGVYFSLDAAFFDPLRGVPNTGSAAANGFLPGAVLNVPVAGAAPVVWAGPGMLGLDLGGPGTDDLDALAIRENGIPGFQPGVAGGDVVRFSVRRGSFVIGLIDSLQGLPIEPGDILAPPPAFGMPPGIVVCAEALGLATARSGFGLFGADMDGLDAVNVAPSTIFSFCNPGIAGVAPCPCGQPIPAGTGCDNSSATGGAVLTAAGAPSLGADTLVFTTAGEKPTATSIVLQGDAVAPAGIVFGMGIRCAAGTLKRLYTKTAVGGSITAPVGTDPTVSARSAALGDVIAAGKSRYYGVYYRDPIVLGGCPPASTFNITQTLAVYWAP